MNVPISGGKVLDTTRITACIPTINYALKNNAKILLVEYEKYNSLDEKIYNFNTEGHE